jgi:site-specific DNA-methyltransferase (adenine-specific)
MTAQIDAPILNARNKMDGLDMLRSLERRSASAVFFDGQYRQGLDSLKFGNEGARQIDRAALPQMTDADIKKFMVEIERIMKFSSHLFLWIDKFALVSGSWHKWMPPLTSLAVVDGLVWDKRTFGMGRRSRGRFEFVVVLQKGPRRAADCWTDHSMADVWPEKIKDRMHPHQKPQKLLRRLVRTCTKPGNLVVDPCAGSYAVLEACNATNRNFIGSDLI